MQFQYDPNKSASNAVKHGVDFEQAQALWDDEERIEFDLAYEAERRCAVVGMLDGKLWTAIVTYRGDAVRIISVRRSHKAEERLYDENL